MQKIVPHLWFDREAVEATEFYLSVFDDAESISRYQIQGTPSGEVDIIAFKLRGFEFMAISAGPYFRPNPAISFTLPCDSVEEVEHLWQKLSRDGTVLMELGEYPFSPRYGWVQDRYGVSWQIIFFPDIHLEQKIIPHLMFTREVCGLAEEAMSFYASIFSGSTVEDIFRYQNQAPDKDGTVAHAFFNLAAQKFGAMDSAQPHDFTFNEAISFIVRCKTQEEIDYFWQHLSAVPESEQCGWLKDKYGVSWQILPDTMNELILSCPEKTTPALMQMRKIDWGRLKKAGE
ncbi:MAG: VOC family protein [Legionellaceae bacterium]|nr:VOC family protein [Legionellaceae bacterium]